MASNTRRKPPKSPAPPIDLDEIEQDPGFRGMLSFLEVSLDSSKTPPTGQSPIGHSQPGAPSVTETLTNDSRMELPPTSPLPTTHEPPVEPPMGESSVVNKPMDLSGQEMVLQKPTGEWLVGQSQEGALVPYIEVEGRGKRPLRYCRNAQDAHTSTEQIVYQTLFTFGKRHGHVDSSGSLMLDIGLSQLCSILKTDHKNAKRILGSLQEKLAIEVVRQPDYRLAIPTRYRIYTPEQILTRRHQAGLIWVVRTRAIRFVDLAMVNRLMREQQPEPYSPMGQ